MNWESERQQSQARPVAIVTGGGRGIGAACCRSLARQGFRVGIHYRTSEKDAQMVLEEDVRDGFLLKADLANIEEINAIVKEIKEKAGRVDVLINNAGISINIDIMSMKIDEFDRQRETTRGAWYLTKRILRLFMLREGLGRIINISSVAGHKGNGGQIPYTMEKAALDAFTKSLARELQGRNILVNSVAPGFIDTEMTRSLPEEIKQRIIADVPLGRMGSAEEVAEVAVFLATSGTYIQGTVIHVNGGLYGG